MKIVQNIIWKGVFQHVLIAVKIRYYYNYQNLSAINYKY